VEPYLGLSAAAAADAAGVIHGHQMDGRIKPFRRRLQSSESRDAAGCSEPEQMSKV